MIYERPFVQSWGTVGTVLDVRCPSQFMLPVSPVKEDWRVQKFIDLIDSDPASIRWNLEQICKELQLCMSARQARRLFKTCTGIGIKEYAKKKRLDVSARQLQTADAAVKSIAVEAAYRHLDNFTSSFMNR